MWPIALKTLVADRGKLLTALVGVVFSIVLVNVQGGLFVGLIRKAGLLVDCGEADIWVGHKHMHNVDFPSDIPRRWVDRIRTVPGVRQAEPCLLGFADMTLPSGGFEGVVVVGVEPGSLLGSAWNLSAGHLDAIRHADGIVVDDCEEEKLEYLRVGDVREVGGRRARVVGTSHGITGFLVAPYVFTVYGALRPTCARTRKSPPISSCNSLPGPIPRTFVRQFTAVCRNWRRCRATFTAPCRSTSG